MPRTVIRDTWVFDSEDGAGQRGVDVSIEGTEVVELGPHQPGTSTPDATMIDGRQLYLIPGLIDSHVHLCSGRHGVGRQDLPHDYMRRQLLDRPDDYLAMSGLLNAQDALRNGVTTVRDLGSRHNQALTLRDALIEGMAIGPRVVAAGTAVAMSGGHGTSGPFENIQADGADGVRAAVRRQVKAGVDCIKVQASGGLATFPHEDPRRAELTLEELRAGVEAAHGGGRLVAAHTGSAESIDRCIRAGVDSIEHGYLMTVEQARELAVQGRTYGPTLMIVQHNLRNLRRRGEHERAKVIETVFQTSQRAAFTAAAEAGVMITCGTDGLGMEIADELACMVELGMTPSEALVTATKNSAIACGLWPVCGRIAPGSSADLLALTANPTVDIAAVRDIAFVCARGRVIMAN
jgi:imidazolonepropionase-like amidohydrolase